MAKRRNLRWSWGEEEEDHQDQVQVRVLLSHLPGCMLALRCGTQHGNVGHNDNFIFGSRRQIFTELVNLAKIIAQRSIVVLHNVYLFPRLTEEQRRKGKRFTWDGGSVGRYLPVHIGSHLIDNGLGAIAEEIIGIGHIVHIQTNAGLYRWLCPPIEGLRTGSQSYHTIHNRIDQYGELTGNQNAADYQYRRNTNCNPWK